MTETLRLAAKAALSAGAIMAVHGGSPELEANCDCQYASGCYTLGARTCQVGDKMECAFNGTSYYWAEIGSCSSG